MNRTRFAGLELLVRVREPLEASQLDGRGSPSRSLALRNDQFGLFVCQEEHLLSEEPEDAGKVRSAHR